ncbi:MAG: succinate dehydrogenase/fumarate reductase cytochrome b subunit [Prevotella sp.]|uniref:succinate dehydrogenase/fumarate reductase cytochrome b subunit n=1 Tax=Prevotella lacticifex TaxID=2854755 RepID=UPI001CC5A8B4|nr:MULTISPECIES: succinate dehydrogenase/fumarate reductase cytochrome b subunit [Prevotella]MDD6853708.1 succinate dehydrogenase/fumarate reductase cytochrome b subunit [Prevotella sp.]MDY6266586.1 succinate dehydrogenase/fumarate reductase cytochrome b subunit [Prevotella sp.]
MWLINSPIGRKVVMSLTGICLILFLTFHCCMNVAAFFSASAYNTVCEFLGSNWYAVLGTLGLAFLAVCHIVYAFILTAQNRRARGDERYAVTDRRPEVSWASQNMLVLGLIILIGLFLHLYNFWGHMMFAELAGVSVAHDPADGFAWIQDTFANPVFSILYLVWLCAIWFHLSHGFWSAMQTLGFSGKIWLKRWQMIGIVYVTVLMGVFAFLILSFWLGFAPSYSSAL